MTNDPLFNRDQRTWDNMHGLSTVRQHYIKYRPKCSLNSSRHLGLIYNMDVWNILQTQLALYYPIAGGRSGGRGRGQYKMHGGVETVAGWKQVWESRPLPRRTAEPGGTMAARALPGKVRERLRELLAMRSQLSACLQPFVHVVPRTTNRREPGTAEQASLAIYYCQIPTQEKTT